MNIQVRKIYGSEEKVEVNNRICKVCSKPFNYNGWLKNRGRYQSQPDNNACESCNRWIDYWYKRNDREVVRFNQNHYIVGNPTDKFKGMGSRKVIIYFNDGSVIETDNLWHQGRIPDVWVGYGLEDNAKEIKLC